MESNVFFPVDRYDYIVNGEALREIHAYMEEEHTFADYTVVSMQHYDPQLKAVELHYHLVVQMFSLQVQNRFGFHCSATKYYGSQ